MFRPYLLGAAVMALASIAACGDDTTTTKAGGDLPFEGASWVVPDDVGHLVVGWKPVIGATDYRVYVSRIQGRELKTTPAIRTLSSSVVITPDTLGQKYFVIVRAADEHGAEDNNTVEKSATATPDKTAPQFAGATAATPSGNAGATLTWAAASDDFTPPEAIVYDVFAGASRASLAHVATSGPGDTSLTLTQLGDPTQSFFFEVRARDLARNESADTPIVTSALGQDATPPVFAGCKSAAFTDAKSGIAKWDPATDNHSAQSALSYAVFVGTKAGGEDFTAPPAAKVVNATSATLPSLVPGTTYYVVCRAFDEAGNSDANTAEQSFTTPSDVTPPKFAGISSTWDAKTSFDAVNRKVSLSWSAATDDQTPAPQIVYDVYESLVSGTYDFTAPVFTTAPGALSATLSDLPSNATLNFVVRARDQAGNHDGNKAEASGKTVVSFSLDVQPIFNRNCAVVGCHVTGPQVGGMNLAPAFAYDAIVNVPGGEMPSLSRVAPGNSSTSWLWKKIHDQPPAVGLPMPAPQTGNTLSQVDESIIQSWIDDANAPNN